MDTGMPAASSLRAAAAHSSRHPWATTATSIPEAAAGAGGRTGSATGLGRATRATRQAGQMPTATEGMAQRGQAKGRKGSTGP